MSHICPHCDKCFTTSSARRQHIRRIHMAVKTCSCKVCHKKFYSAKNCATHEEIHLDDSQRERPFRCDNCQNSFHQKHTLKNHIRNVHTTMKPFICEFCGKAFKVDYYRAAHLQRVHLKEKQYRCRECGKDFAKRIDLTNHFKVHQANRDRLPCPHCHRIFIGDKRLSSHIELTHQQKGFPCVFPGCGKKFSTDQVASFHYKTIHGTVRPFPCAHCDTTFKRKDTLAKHVARKHSNKFLFKCSTCGKSFNQKANLAQHERSHSTRKEFKCPQCPAQYRWRASLIQHIAEKHNNQNNPRLPCPISGCGATSKNKILLKVHLKLRNNSKKTKQCYFCPFMFHRTTNSHYHDHVRMHTTEKPFNCTKCYSSFSNKQVLNNHQKFLHPTEPRRTYKCPICGKSFLSQTYINYHVRQVHFSERNYHCTMCGRDFSSEYVLHLHIRKIHTNEKPYKCHVKQCPFSAFTEPALRDHVIHYHVGGCGLICYFCGKLFAAKEKLYEHIGTHTEETGWS